jgi:hypothetical protein
MGPYLPAQGGIEDADETQLQALQLLHTPGRRRKGTALAVLEPLCRRGHVGYGIEDQHARGDKLVEGKLSQQSGYHIPINEEKRPIMSKRDLV